MLRKTVLLVAATLLGLPAMVAARQPAKPALTPEQTKALLLESFAWMEKSLQFEKEANWPAAIAAAEKSQALIVRVIGLKSTALLQHLGKLHEACEDFPAAEKARAEVLRLEEKRLGKDHWQVTDARLALAHSKAWARLDPGQRRRWAETQGWIKKRDEAFGNFQLGTGSELGRKIVETCRELWGEDDPETAAAIAALGQSLNAQGKNSDAEHLHRQALTIRLKVLGKEHPDVAASYASLADVLKAMGHDDKSRELNRQALDIRLATLGNTHGDTAMSYNSLASDLREQGQYAEAEKLYRKAVAVCIKVHGKDHGLSTASYDGLAQVLRAQGRQAEAEELFRLSLAIRLKDGTSSLYTALAYHDLATALVEQGKYAEAAELQGRALAVYRKVLPKDHRMIAASYHTLAFALHLQGQNAEAAEFLRNALDIHLKVLGKDHSDVAMTYNNLAMVLSAQGLHDEADQRSREGLDICLKLQGDGHPDAATAYTGRALILYAWGKYAAAEKMALAGAESFQAARLRASFTGMDRSAFSAKSSPMAFLACVLAHNGKPAQAWHAFEQNLGRGLFDDLTARTTRRLSDVEHQREERLLAQLNDTDKRLPELLGGKTKNPEAASKLREVRDGLTAELTEFQSELVTKYGVLAGNVYGLKRVQKSLAADAALVGWIDWSGHAKSENPAGEHWAVLVRSEGEPVCVRLTGIGRSGVWSKDDDELPGTVRGILHNPNLVHQDALAKLGRQRLDPLQKHLLGVRHLVVLPSSMMAGIPVEALTDAYRISYAPSATVFAWLQEKRDPSAAGNKLLALGDAVFSPEQAKKAAAVTQLLRGEKFAALPGTRFEVERLAGLVKTHGGQATPFLGVHATRVNLERLAEKNRLADFHYIHLATHAKADPKGGLNSFLVLSSENPDETNYATLSAGQILRTWKLNADLVTLSACQTALGEQRGGEGYLGFSQALLLAGARTLVLSQWQVSDHASAAFMVRFYQNLLGERPGLKQPLSKIEALEEARRWLRELPRAEALKLFADMPDDFRSELPAGARPFEHPNYWAAFILVGDPGDRK
jgi:CHAT domain-containing protein